MAKVTAFFLVFAIFFGITTSVKHFRDCGRRYWSKYGPQMLISDGKVVDHYAKWPWMAKLVVVKESNGSITNDIHYNCTGTIISAQHILTSAQCMDPYETGQIRVYIGAEDWAKGTEYGVSEKHAHPRYKKGVRAYADDIAVVKLTKELTVIRFFDPTNHRGDPLVHRWGYPNLTSTELTFSRYLMPICISFRFNDDDRVFSWRDGRNVTTSTAYIAGWGSNEQTMYVWRNTQFQYPTPEWTGSLYDGKVKLVKDEKCNWIAENYIYNNRKRKNKGARVKEYAEKMKTAICVQGKPANIENGDIGAPLMVEGHRYGRQAWMQIGVASGGALRYRLSKPYQPRVFTSVGHYCDFIASVTYKGICGDVAPSKMENS